MAHREEILRHFRPEEHVLAEKVMDWADRVSQRYRPVLSPFLNPREQYIMNVLVRRNPDLGLYFDGGYEGAERCRGWIAPPYHEPEESDFGLSFFKLETASSEPLQHKDVLGSLLGLGIKREKLGDILPQPSGCHLIVASEMADFVRLQLQRVGRISVRIEEIGREELVVPEKKMSTDSVSVASPRLDAVASAGFGLSRSKVVSLIKSGKCHINWKISENPSSPVESGDVISLRGYGRIQVGERKGNSKKGRIILGIKRFI